MRRTKQELAGETAEQKKARRREYAYTYWLNNVCKGTGKTWRDTKNGTTPQPRKRRYRSDYYCWLFPLVGEPITLGPFCSAATAMNKRVQGIRKLIAAGNARDWDILWLERYDAGVYK